MTPNMMLPGLEVTWATDPANGAHPNEDCVAVVALPDGSGVLIVVSDGMGGHASGDTASGLVCERLIQTAPQLLPTQSLADRFEAFLRAFYDTDVKVRDTASNDLRLLGMGATALSAAITPTTCLHLHTGDSRLYHFRDGQRLYRTRDHSVVELKMDIGDVTEEEMHLHPMRSMLLASIGGGDRKGQLDVAPKWQESTETQEAELNLLPGDLVLLCTDGLNGVLGEQGLQALVAEHYQLPTKGLVQALISAVKAAGGEDNVTVAAVRTLSVEQDAATRADVESRPVPLLGEDEGIAGEVDTRPQRRDETWPRGELPPHW
jgi:serine/threonine protein phosphatase PrpC